jgi:D-3-phosphoglycerate dehydrogenase
MRILVADRFDHASLESLRAAGCEIEMQPDLAPEGLRAALAELRPDALVVRGLRVDAEALAASDRLALVVRAGANAETIDVDAASRRGIAIATTPGRNAAAVAELAFGLILAIDRRIPDQIADLRDGRWNRGAYARSPGLYGRTLGIVGLGPVGREMAARAKAFGMRVVAWGFNLTQAECDELGVDHVESLVNLARLSDVVSVHAPAVPESDGLVGERFLLAMRTGAILVNTSRASVLDEKALAKAIAERGLRIGLDVWSDEPAGRGGEFHNPLAADPKVYGTFHVGAATEQAHRATADEAARIVQEWAVSGVVSGCLNLAAVTPATAVLTVRHLNRPGVLAHVFETLGAADINVEEMDNVVYEGHEAAKATIHLSRPPAEEVVAAIRRNPHVLGTSLSLIRRPAPVAAGSP